jgi:dCMP deaminase
MLIAIIGTRLSGKSSVEEYLVSFKGFTAIRLVHDGGITVSALIALFAWMIEEYTQQARGLELDRSSVDLDIDSPGEILRDLLPIPYSQPFSQTPARLTSHFSFLSMNSPTTVSWASPAFSTKCLKFSSPSQMLDHVTKNWRSDFVTMDLNTIELVNSFVKRPFFMLLSVDAPILDRFNRAKSKK